MNRTTRYLESRLFGDTYFLYTAFAPMKGNTRDKKEQEDECNHVLVKVGISTIPMNRISSVHMNSPFRIAYAAFTPLWCNKAKAERTESAILKHFHEFKTRGEWLMLPNTPDFKKEFAFRTRIYVGRDTGRPVEWRRVTHNEIVSHGMRKLSAA